MESVFQEKREASVFIPYRVSNGRYEFFLQKRDEHAARAPGIFGMFGGGIDEGETYEEAFFREVKEELAYVPQKPIYFSRYETAIAIFHVYFEEVPADFESHIVVGEGEYGKFFTMDELQTNPQVGLAAKIATLQFADRYAALAA